MPTARELKLFTGSQTPGTLNAITDVPGVLIGHQTIRRNDCLTGVTAVLPHGGNLFMQKTPAAVHVINGFGKSVGLMQIEEMGTIECPILLTNTFSVGTCANALIHHAISKNPEIGRKMSTFNPVVFECNDGWLSHLQAMEVTEDDALAAIENARGGMMEQGNAGAGNGMRCFGFKGGFGTASRKLTLDGADHHLGVLVLSNFGEAGNLVLPDDRVAPHPEQIQNDKGSVIVVLATDIPLDFRQLRRVARRCGAGLARVGSFWGTASGDIAVAFSTANQIAHSEERDIVSLRMLNENKIDLLFAAAADATHEAVLNSMLMSEATSGRDGHFAPSLADALSTVQ